MLHRDIELLQPEFKDKVKVLLARLDQLGIKYYINETLRDLNVQIAYYSQGRNTLDKTNTLRKAAGLWPLTEKENKNKVTWTMKSKHIDGLAIDICPKKDDSPWWSAPDEKWKEIADVAKSLGFDPGYYWKQKDCPHIQ